MSITEADLERWSQPMKASETRPILDALIAEVHTLRAVNKGLVIERANLTAAKPKPATRKPRTPKAEG